MFNNIKREKESDQLQQNDYVKSHTGVKEKKIKHTCNTSPPGLGAAYQLLTKRCSMSSSLGLISFSLFHERAFGVLFHSGMPKYVWVFITGVYM